MPKESTVTKEKILAAAEAVFCANGYEKARMEDIAKAAKITKVMLYYHFKNKENIMREMLAWTLAAARREFEAMAGNFITLRSVKPEFLLERMGGILEPRKAIIRVLFSEGLKGTMPMHDIFATLLSFFDSVRAALNPVVRLSKDRQEFFTRLFFFTSLPGIMYYMFGDDFARALGADKKDIHSIFAKKFGQTLRATILQ